MKKLFFILFFLNFLYPHDFWIEISNPFPKLNEEIKIFIKGGHKIFESEFAPKEKLIKEFKLVEPDGNEINLEYKKENNYFLSSFKINKEGVYLIYFILSKPDGEIFYMGKNYFYVEKLTEFKNLDYDFEINLKDFDFSKDKEINFPQGNYEFMNEKGSGFFKNSYKVKKGLNLLIKREKGKVCTLTFYSH